MRSGKNSDARLTNLFLDMLAGDRGAGANTLDAYRRDLTDFSEFLGRAGQNFAGVETQALRDYLADLDARGFKSSSVARRLSAMRHLFRFLLSERFRRDDPAAILSGPKRGRGLPKVLSISDVDRLLVRAKALAEAPEASAPQRLRAIRLYCLLEVLYGTGLRVWELVSLPLSASRRDASMIVVRGKGDKERLVPLNEASRQAMADYLAAIEALKADKKKNAAASKWLFPSFGESGHLTCQHFARDLNEPAAAPTGPHPEEPRSGVSKDGATESSLQMREVMRERGDLFFAQGIGDLGHRRLAAAGPQACFVVVQRLDQIILALTGDARHRF